MKAKSMITLTAVVATLAFFLVLTVPTQVTKAKNDYTIQNLEFNDLGEYIVDKRTGCLYFTYTYHASSGTTAVYGNDGEVIGCGGKTKEVEEYFKTAKKSKK